MSLKADRSCPDLASLSSRTQATHRPTTAPDDSGNLVRGRWRRHPKQNSGEDDTLDAVEDDGDDEAVDEAADAVLLTAAAGPFISFIGSAFSNLAMSGLNSVDRISLSSVDEILLRSPSRLDARTPRSISVSSLETNSCSSRPSVRRRNSLPAAISFTPNRFMTLSCWSGSHSSS